MTTTREINVKLPASGLFGYRSGPSNTNTNNSLNLDMRQSCFNNSDTLVVKGFAICMMFYHHLFAFPKRLIGGGYCPLLLYIDLDRPLAGFGKFCVDIFIFLSGYGLLMSYGKSAVTNSRTLLQRLVKMS